MAEINERDFKGVWIPKEVWIDTRLNMLEKGILTEIDSLDMSGKGCYASNKHIAEFCQCSETKVSTAISKLIDLGYLYVQSFDGRQRVLKSCLSNFERQDIKKSKADFNNLRESNTYNNTPIKTSNKDIYIDEFEILWKMYPRKIGKPKALKAYQKARNNGTTLEEVKQGIENYCKHIKAKQTETEYIKHGSTWFNNECWADEYDFTPKGDSKQNRGGNNGKQGKPDYSKLDETFEQERKKTAREQTTDILKKLFNEFKGEENNGDT